MYRSVFAALVLLLFSMNCAQGGKNDDEEAVKDTLIAMWAAIERGDLEAYLKHVHDDYTVFGESDVYLQSGKALERSSYERYLQRAQSIRTFMHQPEVHVSGKTAWMTYYWADSGLVDGAAFSSRGKSTRIFVKEDGKWLCIHGHFTAVE